MNPLILIGILLVILILLGMAAAIIIGNEAEKKKRALAVIQGHHKSESSEGDERQEQDRRRAEIAKKLKEQDEGEGKEKKKGTISDLMEQAGMKADTKKFWIFSVVFSIICVTISQVMGVSMIGVIFIGITALLGLPRMFLKMKVKRRQKKFLEEFADALEAMVRLLKAGMPVAEAISMAGREYVGPVGEEMSRIYDAQKVGISLPDATYAAAERMPLTEMQMFATAVTIQQQTGASLSEVLMNLAGTIRARYRLKRKVQALSSEAKASAMIIGSLPFLIGGGLWAINPEYIGILFETVPGRAMLIGGGFWMGIGIFIMRAMINFKV